MPASAGPVADVGVLALAAGLAVLAERVHVDLAVLARRTIPSSLRFELEGRLEEKLRQSVDLIDLRKASAVFRVQILKDAALLVDNDPGRRAEFECFALADYARLNEERAGILEDVRRSGRVHG